MEVERNGLINIINEQLLLFANDLLINVFASDNHNSLESHAPRLPAIRTHQIERQRILSKTFTVPPNYEFTRNNEEMCAGDLESFHLAPYFPIASTLRVGAVFMHRD